MTPAKRTGKVARLDDRYFDTSPGTRCAITVRPTRRLRLRLWLARVLLVWGARLAYPGKVEIEYTVDVGDWLKGRKVSR